MNKDLAAEMRMQATVTECLNNNNDLVEKYPRLKLERDAFGAKCLKLADEVAKREGITTGITLDKVATFSNYGEQLNAICLKAHVWATDNNNQTLATIFAFTPNKFNRQTYARKLETGKAIYAALYNNAAALVTENIADADIAAIASAGKLCETANISTSMANNNKKTAKGNVDLLLADINKSLVTMGKLIASEYVKTAPDFVSGYQNSRKVETVGVRHTGINAIVTAAATGKPIEHAVLTIIGTKKRAISNMAGVAAIIRMRTGSYHINIGADGYTTYLQDVVLTKGKTLELAVVLDAL